MMIIITIIVNIYENFQENKELDKKKCLMN